MKYVMFVICILLFFSGCSSSSINFDATKYGSKAEEDMAIRNLKLYGKYSNLLLNDLDNSSFYTLKKKTFREEAEALIKKEKERMNRTQSKKENYYEEYYNTIINY